MTSTPLHLPQSNGNVSQLLPDYSVFQHIFVAEGEGARCIQRLLVNAPKLAGRREIYYADTMDYMLPGHVESLELFPFHVFDVYKSRLGLLRMLPMRLDQLSPPFRIYAAASAWFVKAIGNLLEKSGIDQEWMASEYCDPPHHGMSFMTPRLADERSAS